MGAVASLGLLASCSSDDDLSTGGKNDLQQIKIGMGVQANVATRDTGTVGAVGEKENTWANQTVNVYMLNKGTLELAKFGEDPIYNNTVLTTPDGNASGIATELVDGVAQYKYYPTTKTAFDFWGYRLDDAIQGEPAVSEDGTKQEVGFELNGSQDIMVGKATPDEEDLAKCADETKIYSAYAARRDVQPDIVFKHLLSRLVFSVTGGNQDACNDTYGVKVTGITVKSKYTGKLIVAYTPDAEVTNELVPTEDVTDLELMQRDDADTQGNHNLIELKAQGPKWDDAEDKAIKTNIGEAIHAVPADQYELTIKLKQLVKTQTDPAAEAEKTFSYNDVIKLADDKVFEAGYSYNVNITVYGLSEIKINTTLTPWVDGGNIDMNPEDNGTPGATPTPGETYDYTIVEGTEEAESTVYANLDELKAAVKAGTATEGKIYPVGESEPYTYYKVTKKSTTVTPAPTVTYKFTPYDLTDGDQIAGEYDTEDELNGNAADLLKVENLNNIYKVGTGEPFSYFKVVVNE